MKKVLVASLVVHAALFALLARTRVAPAPALPAAAPEMPIEVGWDVPTPAPATPTEGAVAMATDRRATAPGPGPLPSSTTQVVEAPPDTAPYAESGTLFVWSPNIGLGGKPGSNPFLVGGPGQSTGGAGGASSADPLSVPENKKAEQAVRDALRARDQGIGLGLEGPVVTALEGATHDGFSPEHGVATFLAVIDERGLVIDLKLVSSNASNGDGMRGWEDVRKRAVKSLASAKIEMRGVKHAELKIEVASDVVLPSGSDPKKPVKPLTGKRQATPIITNAPGSPGGADTVQTVEVAQFDVADVNARASRVVHAKLVMMTTR